MEANIAVPNEKKPTWGGGGVKPFGASYGKMMMWFFIVSDANAQHERTRAFVSRAMGS